MSHEQGRANRVVGDECRQSHAVRPGLGCSVGCRLKLQKNIGAQIKTLSKEGRNR